ncbi:MAG: nucleoside-diphosphate kinase [Clostridiales bacterium]|jgi:nucleoside-diphosphate kinase|nr:nucleoside-diphosphate kinase [Eubacteriales bacterium]MDH7565059.1 nucleoside-diphosphate kinase [Clostridiales bacterium]
MEKTLVILKPDAVKRKLVGEIVSRFEKKNMDIVRMKMCVLERSIVEEHYSHVKHLPFYSDMVTYMISGPVVLMVLEGEGVIRMVRSMMGKTSVYDSLPGTIRGDYGFHEFENLIHASDSPENAEIEIKRFFA